MLFIYKSHLPLTRCLRSARRHYRRRDQRRRCCGHPLYHGRHHGLLRSHCMTCRRRGSAPCRRRARRSRGHHLRNGRRRGRGLPLRHCRHRGLVPRRGLLRSRRTTATAPVSTDSSSPCPCGVVLRRLIGRIVLYLDNGAHGTKEVVDAYAKGLKVEFNVICSISGRSRPRPTCMTSASGSRSRSTSRRCCASRSAMRRRPCAAW